jgi:hypothetical protein
MTKILLFLFCCGFVACTTKDDSAVQNEYAADYIKNLNLSDTFLYDIPIDSRGEIDSFSLNDLNNFERLTGLKSISKGFDSIEIRIAFVCYMKGPEKMVILRNQNKRWDAELSEIYPYSDGALSWRGLDSIKRKIVYERPKSGWIKFINQLFDLKILTIEHEFKIPGFQYQSVMDGCAISVEVSTENVYRFYGFANPKLYTKQHWQATNMIAIEKLLYNEFKTLGIWDKETEHQTKMRIKELENRHKNGTKKVKIEEISITDSENSIKKAPYLQK